MRNLLVSAFLAILFAVCAERANAYDTSGVHAFFNDDKNQFVDLWLNNDGNVTIKASNGRPWRPMWVVAHANFMSGGQSVAKKDYHVYCPSPNAGGKGAETWFKFVGPGVSGIDKIGLSTNKEKPWGKPKGEWTIMISTSAPAP
ncbi:MULTISPECIES: hypothetical protein [Rhizobium]|nr:MULTISPECIES: hypothetical protein [Rhizobium]MCA0807301.1 hypothetical protein [Rhizobium sp. T1473]MCS0463493.1 hypothetical protein [Rhizobium favelukesii]